MKGILQHLNVKTGECIMFIDKSKLEKTREVMKGASTGIAVAVAFINVALIVTELITTVSEYEPQTSSETENAEEGH